MSKEFEQKRSHRRINALDVVIVLLILCLVAAFAYRIYRGVSDPYTSKNSEYIVEFECEEVYNSLSEYIEEGEAVRLASNGEILGHVYMSKGDEKPIWIVTEAPLTDGEAVEDETETESGEASPEDSLPSYEPVRLAGKLSLSADAIAEKAGNYYTVGDVGIAIGSVVEVYTEDTVFTLLITDIYAME